MLVPSALPPWYVRRQKLFTQGIPFLVAIVHSLPTMSLSPSSSIVSFFIPNTLSTVSQYTVKFLGLMVFAIASMLSARSLVLDVQFPSLQ